MISGAYAVRFVRASLSERSPEKTDVHEKHQTILYFQDSARASVGFKKEVKARLIQYLGDLFPMNCSVSSSWWFELMW